MFRQDKDTGQGQWSSLDSNDPEHMGLEGNGHLKRLKQIKVKSLKKLFCHSYHA
jgi:hypothetical protein